VSVDHILETSSIKVIGYCDLSHDAILNCIRKNEYQKLQIADGEYTIIYEDMEEVIVITSMIGAMQYFYYYDGKRFAHGHNLIKLIKDLQLPWIWDWESLGDLCELENLTENRTLHRDIKKVPAGTVLHYRNTLKLRTIKILDQFKISDADPIEAINILNQQTLKWSGKDTIISLSGGFDSRVILSSMLKQSIYPTVVTVGSDHNSDMQVAEMISTKFLLDHIKVALSVDDFITSGECIAHLTNGSKPSCHWHTFLYPRKAGIKTDQSFFVGTLGEFARSYYFDKGFVSLFNDISPDVAQAKFWLLKLTRHRTFKNNELTSLCENLKNEINQDGIRRRAKRNASLSSGDFLSGGTRYYLEQRVPNFYANGISMYNHSASWRSPFHNIKWLEQIWNLSDHWKLGSNWHRLAIFRNLPELLDFPEEKGFNQNRMLRKAPLLYWLSIMQKNKYKTYDMSTDWFAESKIHQLILDNSSLLDEIIDRRLLIMILEQHLAYRNRTRAISFILTILFFKISLGRVK
jgi:hypothetical protein